MLATLHEAEALAVALDDPRRLGQVAHFLANYFTSMGAYAQAIAAAQRALALATATGDVVQQALANFRLGQAYHTQSDYRGALTAIRRPSRPSTGPGTPSASALIPCRPWPPVPGSPCAMPSWAGSLRAVPWGTKGSRLPKQWHTVGA